MEKYLNQLLDDLRDAHRPEQKIQHEQRLSDHFTEVARFVSGAFEEEQQVFGEVCGVQKILFPPAQRLSDEQLVQLCQAIRQLMHSWHLSLALPEKMPLKEQYRFLTDVFNTPVNIVSDGFIEIELCDYEVDHCVFGDYCSCREDFGRLEEEERLYIRRVRTFTEELARKLKPGADKISIRLSIEEVEIDPKEKHSVQTLAQWLDLSLDDFPPPLQLGPVKADKISNILLRLIPANEEMQTAILALDWDKRYRILTQYLDSKVWFDGHQTLYLLPLSEEEKSQLNSPLDLMDGEDDLPF